MMINIDCTVHYKTINRTVVIFIYSMPADLFCMSRMLQQKGLQALNSHCPDEHFREIIDFYGLCRSEERERSAKVRGEEQVYLLCELLEFLPAEYIPWLERGDFVTTSGGALFRSLDLLV